jgi:hypothetical protein
MPRNKPTTIAEELLPKSVFRKHSSLFYISKNNVTNKVTWHNLGKQWDAAAQKKWKELVIRYRKGPHATRLVYSFGSGPIPLSFMKQQLTNARKNAKAKSLPCTITLEDITDLAEKSQGRCSLSGIPYEFGAAEEMYRHPSRRKRVWAPSIDRIDSAVGYVPGNVRLVCMAVNVARQEFGDDVLLKLAKALSNIQGLTKMPKSDLSYRSTT